VSTILKASERSRSGQRRLRRWALPLLVVPALALAACAPTIIKHGHLFQDGENDKVQVGMSPQQVSAAIGSPTTTASVSGGQAYYYIGSVEKQTAFFKPEEVQRHVLAVYFSQQGSVERVAQYGLKDGKVINFNKSETPNSAKDENLIKKLFRNLGAKQQLFKDDSN